ncbi:DUF4407 domain-containing protein [Mucilaginibacter ginsenosidivorans]|uniref:DUF4407 domain-containing protein n=1 Tax=Mucilaginibacter ginsenosidivorans TaxID=398053 RepID=A0A5B8UUQ5_9SPHI|nr:DUF4407 domain-containing protein [Mucilaginibacter ginsenosidivorans]QEC62505.1 DUF4407 domain-containing protein [Mucilaginibacter ginsenosidivorans]
METNYYKNPKPTWLMRQFWKVSGADRYILEKSTYSDQVKYTCMGGIVLATGVMAALAGGYAFYTIFAPKGDAIDDINTIVKSGHYDPTDMPTAILAAVFGLIWGAIIFNIDRFIVTSTGKGDGTEAITKQELKSALPRIIMGTIIALTISKPVEIRMFKSEIDAKLYQTQLEAQKEYEIRTRKNFEDRIKDLDKENAGIQDRIDNFMKVIATKDSLWNVETSKGQGGRGEGEGPMARSYKAERDRVEAEKNQFTEMNKSKILDIERRRAAMNTELEAALKKNKSVSAGLDGLLERIKIAQELAPGISIFITLLFMAIELTPIFFKLMLIKGPYDYLEENIKDLVKAQNGIEIQHDYYKDKEGIERELVIHHEVERMTSMKARVIEAQKELNEYIIDQWKAKQKRQIDGNLEAYVSTVLAEEIVPDEAGGESITHADKPIQPEA